MRLRMERMRLLRRVNLAWRTVNAIRDLIRACPRADGLCKPRRAPAAYERETCAAAARAAEEIYNAHAPLLRAVALRRFRIPAADVDALVHDVFASCFVNAPNVEEPRRYVLGAICNASRQYWRIASDSIEPRRERGITAQALLRITAARARARCASRPAC